MALPPNFDRFHTSPVEVPFVIVIYICIPARQWGPEGRLCRGSPPIFSCFGGLLASNEPLGAPLGDDRDESETRTSFALSLSLFKLDVSISAKRARSPAAEIGFVTVDHRTHEGFSLALAIEALLAIFCCEKFPLGKARRTWRDIIAVP